MLAVRWYLRYGLSYRDVEELLAERGMVVERVTSCAGSAVHPGADRRRPAEPAGRRGSLVRRRDLPEGRWAVGVLYRAIDQHGQVIDVLASPERDLAASAGSCRGPDGARRPAEVTTDRAPAYPRVLDELVPEAWHVVEQYANNPIEADHGRLKARTRPMRGLKRIRSAQLSVAGMRSSRTSPRTLRTRPRYRARPPARSDLHRTRHCHLNSASTARSCLLVPNATAPDQELAAVHGELQACT